MTCWTFPHRSQGDGPLKRTLSLFPPIVVNEGILIQKGKSAVYSVPMLSISIFIYNLLYLKPTDFSFNFKKTTSAASVKQLYNENEFIQSPWCEVFRLQMRSVEGNTQVTFRYTFVCVLALKHTHTHLHRPLPTRLQPSQTRLPGNHNSRKGSKCMLVWKYKIERDGSAETERDGK